MTGPFAEINQELVSITEAHASGQMDRHDFRRRRRELICQVTGETPPSISEEEQAARVSEDDTHPKMAAVSVPDPQPADEPDAAVEATVAESDESDEKPAGPAKVSYWKLTALVLLVAVAGLAGLLWFILR